MGLTGILYGGIVCLWLCYLVPLALRRHDEAVRTRSVDRFSSAMRVLGRSEARTSSPEPVVRRRSLATSPAAAAGATIDRTAPARTVTSTTARRAAREAAARRRRVLAVLLAVTAGVAVVAVVGLIPLWWTAVPVLVVVGFLVTSRLQVSRARATTWESALRTAAGAGVVPAGDEPDEAPTIVLDAVPADARTEPPPAHALDQQPVVAAVVPTADGASMWDPLPVTLPTYVSKPRAERSIRTIDLTGPGAWTSGHLSVEEKRADGGGSEAEIAATPRAVGN